MDSLTEIKLTSDLLVDGVLLKAYRDGVRLPDGQESIREWIDHPGASAVVPYFEDRTTILIRQYRYPPRRIFLEVPAGKMDRVGEPPEDVARRELEEETGWIPGRLEALGSFYPCIGYSNEIIHLFLARELKKGERSLSEGEFVEPLRLPFEEAVGMAQRGEILDMKSALALLYAGRLLAARGDGRG